MNLLSLTRSPLQAEFLGSREVVKSINRTCSEEKAQKINPDSKNHPFMHHEAPCKQEFSILQRRSNQPQGDSSY
jgi:hypothetical protein